MQRGNLEECIKIVSFSLVNFLKNRYYGKGIRTR